MSGRQEKFCSTKCKNTVDQSHEQQQERGKKRKDIAIVKLGGKCSECGYNKNSAALCFHHIDEGSKNFGLTVREFSNHSQSVIDTELDKCILLCHNCHMETHYPQCKI